MEKKKDSFPAVFRKTVERNIHFLVCFLENSEIFFSVVQNLHHRIKILDMLMIDVMDVMQRLHNNRISTMEEPIQTLSNGFAD